MKLNLHSSDDARNLRTEYEFRLKRKSSEFYIQIVHEHLFKENNKNNNKISAW